MQPPGRGLRLCSGFCGLLDAQRVDQLVQAALRGREAAGRALAAGGKDQWPGARQFLEDLGGLVAQVQLVRLSVLRALAGNAPDLRLQVQLGPGRRRDKRLPFSPEQLRLIFNAPLYTGCVDDWFGYATPGDAHPRRGRFWVPLLALFGGLRLNEACQLDVADIQAVEGIDCIRVTAGPMSPGNNKRLKTASSERTIPVHEELKRIGFMSFVDVCRNSGARKLFPELQVSSTGYYSDPFSKWFSRFLSKTGAAKAKTCFHSFRHCYRDALREARIDHEIALALGGWASSGGERGEAAAAYGRGHSVTTLAEAMSRVRYPLLDISHLRAPEVEGVHPAQLSG